MWWCEHCKSYVGDNDVHYDYYDIGIGIPVKITVCNRCGTTLLIEPAKENPICG